MSKYKAELDRAGHYADNGQPDEAMDICNKALLDEPDNPAALYIAGCVMLQAARHVQAIQFAKRLVEVRPKGPLGWEILTNCYGELHRYDESVAAARKALACRRDAKTLEGLAYALVNAGEWKEARECALESIKLGSQPLKEGEPEGRITEAVKQSFYHLMYCELADGNWKTGFEGYRRTLRTKWRKEYQYVTPDGKETQEWMGEPDAIVMVTGEQGIGDEIMAASVVPDAAAACKKFILECDHRLGPIFQRSFPNVLVSPTRRDKASVLSILPTHHKSLFGLSEHFRQTDADFPRKPYLVPREDYVRMFKSLVGEDAIGIAWSGGLLRTGAEPRTAGLGSFLPLLRRGGNFVSLQYGDDSQEVEQLKKDHGIEVKRFPWVTAKSDKADVDLLAGLLGAMKEVVGVHTSALHLASAIGTPTTVLTHKGSGWRYGPSELLWYPPTTKLHKKKSGESWRECVARLVEARK